MFSVSALQDRRRPFIVVRGRADEGTAAFADELAVAPERAEVVVVTPQSARE